MAVFSHIGPASSRRRNNGGRTSAISRRWRGGVRLESLANLSHELRTPVQALLGYVEILREDMPEELGPDAREIVARINANSHDLAQTIENVLDFAVFSAKAESVFEEEIELAELVAQVIPGLDAANAEKHLAISVDMGGAPTLVRSRRRALRAILSNLASNAVKFTERGAVHIAIRGLPSATLADEIEIEVSDTGPGIDPELLDAALEPWRQLSASSARRYRGIGLGLTVVRRNVEALAASLDIQTSRGQGSRFTVRVPIGQ